MACHHRLLKAHTVARCLAWHAIIALVLQIEINDIERGISSPPVDSTHGRKILSVANHHRPLKAHTID